MPTYEYKCKACDNEFEVVQRMVDEPLVECPKCKKPELKKVISGCGFQLKGTGWYQTDFK
jgi:putative FmdB family regulatory protein